MRDLIWLDEHYEDAVDTLAAYLRWRNEAVKRTRR